MAKIFTISPIYDYIDWTRCSITISDVTNVGISAIGISFPRAGMHVKCLPNLHVTFFFSALLLRVTPTKAGEDLDSFCASSELHQRRQSTQ